MDPPHFLLDALNDSITSGTFVDTKFYVFSRREASGRVGSPQALYCNSRVLDTIPYLSTCEQQKLCDFTHLTVWSEVFSGGFSEGQTRDINGGFPSDSHPYTEDYDYPSDSDLEDESFYSGEEDEEPPKAGCDSERRLEYAPDQKMSQLEGYSRSQHSEDVVVSDDPLLCPSSVEPSKTQKNGRLTPLPIERFRILNSNHRQ